MRKASKENAENTLRRKRFKPETLNRRKDIFLKEKRSARKWKFAGNKYIDWNI